MNDLTAGFIIGIQVFLDPVLIVLDQAVGTVEDHLG